VSFREEGLLEERGAALNLEAAALSG